MAACLQLLACGSSVAHAQSTRWGTRGRGPSVCAWTGVCLGAWVGGRRLDGSDVWYFKGALALSLASCCKVTAHPHGGAVAPAVSKNLGCSRCHLEHLRSASPGTGVLRTSALYWWSTVHVAPRTLFGGKGFKRLYLQNEGSWAFVCWGTLAHGPSLILTPGHYHHPIFRCQWPAPVPEV